MKSRPHYYYYIFIITNLVGLADHEMVTWLSMALFIIVKGFTLARSTPPNLPGEESLGNIESVEFSVY